MQTESGNISISTENIFPIIKKWLYSEKDIFLRELVSNSSDAISKLSKLIAVGEANIKDDSKYFIKVELNSKEKTIKITDNGIGMTEDEVKRYINQIAFSGAKEFFEKYKEKGEDAQIIGHFGLGFYSSFMVSNKVEIDTLSYQENAEAVKWVSEDGTDYELTQSDRTERGTTVTLYIADDSTEFLDSIKLKSILNKYFSFLPYEIYFSDISEEKDEKEKQDKENQPINDVKPLWVKAPKDCTDEEYKEFYKKVFNDYQDPLFWIHLNMDYPFNLKGILFFPKLKHEFETMEGEVKLYYNQVFVADNIKEVIPEFLLLLKGTIDCPDLPLNVSRSFLQNDGYVSKISSHITKKVADKLLSLFENDRESYNGYWNDINPFIKFGCIKEPKFMEKVKDIIVYKTIKGNYVTLKEYLEENKDKHSNKVFYVTDENQQAQYIKIFEEHSLNAIILSTLIDNHFIQFIESHEPDVKFLRIDSELSENLKSEDENESKEDSEKLEKLFKDALENDKFKIQVENLKSSSISGMILLSEQSRRMQEMSKLFGGVNMGGMFGNEETLILNKNNKLIQSLLNIDDVESKNEDVKLICKHIYDLAMINHRQLDPGTMNKFIERSNEFLLKIANL